VEKYKINRKDQKIEVQKVKIKKVKSDGKIESLPRSKIKTLIPHTHTH